MVTCMAIRDAQAVIDALADLQTLYVFGVIAARTSKVGMKTSNGTRTTPYVRPFGLMRETSLSRDAVEAAAARLKRAGLVKSLSTTNAGMKAGGSARPPWPLFPPDRVRVLDRAAAEFRATSQLTW
jgi:hypothetical protein